MWRVWQRFMDPEGFVFIDETGAATNMVRRYGWALRGKRLVTAGPHGYWRTTTFVAGSCSTGLVAPPVLAGPMNDPALLAYVEQLLVPMLRRGDTVVMDNLATQCGRRRRNDQGCWLQHSQPAPYSPDLNPIEQALFKLETLLRSTTARTKEAI